MRIGLYYDMRNSAGLRGSGPRRDRGELYATTLRRIAEAEQRGLDAVWLSEHHGFEDGYLPSPLTFAAAVAARTRRVRIGTAVAVAPLIHPLTLAEQASLVDIVSRGRLELGLGAGWRVEEFTAFGADFAQRYRILEDRARLLHELWTSGLATPPPVQEPVPLWVGARGPRGARIAGRVGAGLLWIDSELLAPYRDGLAQGGHDPATARMGGLVNVFLADDPDEARTRIVPAGRHNRETYRGADRVGGRTFPRLRVLTPDAAAGYITDLVGDLPVSDVFCFGDLGGLDADLVDRHIELLTGTLSALVRDREDREGCRGSSR